MPEPSAQAEGTDIGYLTDLSPRDKPWDAHKRQSGQVRDLYQRTFYDAYAGRMAQCSGQLSFCWGEHPETGERRLKLKTCRFCRVRHCPICQWRRSLMWIARFLKALPRIQADHPKARWISLTLTVRNCDVSELKAKIGQMNQAWKRLSQRKQFPVIGFARSTEVTRAYECHLGTTYLGRHGKTWVRAWEKAHRGKTLTCLPTDEVHPHFHVLAMVNPGYFSHSYLTQAEWQQLWKEALRVEYEPVTHIQTVKPNPKRPGSGLDSAIVETFKYTTKPEDLLGDGSPEDQAWLVEFTKQLHKTRSIALGGVLKNYLSESYPEELLTEDGDTELLEEASRLLFGWREVISRYVQYSEE